MTSTAHCGRVRGSALPWEHSGSVRQETAGSDWRTHTHTSARADGRREAVSPCTDRAVSTGPSHSVRSWQQPVVPLGKVTRMGQNMGSSDGLSLPLHTRTSPKECHSHFPTCHPHTAQAVGTVQPIGLQLQKAVSASSRCHHNRVSVL